LSGQLVGRVVVGSLVRVRLGHRNVRGIVIETSRRRVDRELEPILALVVDEPLAPPPLDDLIRWMARRYASPLGAAFRRVVPPRVRGVRRAPEPIVGGPPPARIRAYEGGEALVAAVENRRSGAWSLQCLPGEDRGELIAELVAAAGKASGGAALVAVPEVRYGSSVLAALEYHFPDLARVDSSTSDADRARAWIQMARGHGLGAGGRAALLAPSPNLALIVVDEEHHPTYKEDRSPRFDGRRVALERARLQGAACVLMSPTPSLESSYGALKRELGSVRPSRAARRAARPVVELAEFDEGRAVSHLLHERIKESLHSGARVALLSPASGFARALWCAHCRRSVRCPRCEAGVFLERSGRAMRCRRCGRDGPAPTFCPACNSDELRHMGAGSERLADQVARSFPRASVRRMDPEVLEATGGPAPEGDVYVTTWIGTKVALRPEVALVGVLNADSLIRRPDFRAAEQAHHALAAMSEWAGPAAHGGRLIIQTAEPGHHAIQAVVRADPGFFVERELELRAELGYPPFADLVKIAAHGPRRADLIDEATRTCRRLGASVLGPIEVRAEDSEMSGLECLIKCADAEKVAEGLRGILAAMPAKSHLRVDVDPR